jgi:hypothetical protein
MRIACLAVAVAAAIGLAAVGFVYGTYAAGGSDSSCYALMAEAFASGTLQPSSALVAHVPWPDAAKTFTPGGFVPSELNPTASAPVCAPGFSLLLAPLVVAGGRNAVFVLTPVAGALLVWLTFVAGQSLAGPLAGAMSSVLIATSPAVLYQVVQPMNDITTTALWMGVYVALISRRYELAGLCCGLALLVRPNLLPLAVVAGTYLLIPNPNSLIPTRDSLNPNPKSLITSVGRFRRAVVFSLAALPGVLAVLWLNDRLYGGPLRSGYGELGHLFSISVVPGNAAQYARWFVETQTPFPFLAFAAPLVIDRARRSAAVLALGFSVTTALIYFAYQPFDDWSYLRFLLPAIALMLVLAIAVMTQVALKIVPRTGPFVVAAIALALAAFGVRTAEDRFAFTMQSLEQRYRSAGIVVRDELPPDAVVLSVWDSGAVRFHGRKEALAWAALDPDWLDRSLDWLMHNGRKPYILVESWEEAAFRSRFGSHSAVGRLDWPPKYEIDRVVRIYDPQDRVRYDRGEHVATEFLWPLKD